MPRRLEERKEGRKKRKKEKNEEHLKSYWKILFSSHCSTDFSFDSSRLCFWREMLANSQNVLGITSADG